MSDSYVGVYKDGRVQVISNANDQDHVTPSIVTVEPTVSMTDHPPCLRKQLNVIVGSESAAQDEHSITIFDIKRLLGRSMDDPQVQRYIQTLPYRVVNQNGLPSIEVIENETYSSEEIISLIIGRLKENAEEYLNESVTHAVLTVPAYYSDAQRSAMRDAGALAGLNVIRIINEPTAASIGLGLDQGITGERSVLIYDLGESSLSVTVMVIEDGIHEILATTSDPLESLATGHPPFRDRPSSIWKPLMLAGGKAFDQCLLGHLMRVINNKYENRGRIEDQQRVTTRLLQEAEKAKRLLSTMDEVHIELDTLLETVHDHDVTFHLNDTITRAFFEELCHDLFVQVVAPVPQVLSQAGMNASEIQDIVLVGAASHMPKLQRLILDFFPGKSLYHDATIRPEEAVVLGASTQSGILTGAIETESSCCWSLPLTDLSIGIATVDGVMATLIERNTVEPARKVYHFSTSEDNQTSILIQLYQGERALVKDNRFLGEFELKGLTPTRRGVPRIEVVIEIDTSGMILLSAEEKSTGLYERLTISHHKRYDFGADVVDCDEVIDRMIRDGRETFVESDQLIRAQMANKNVLENYALTVQNLMANLASEIDVSDDSMDEPEKLACHEAISGALFMIDRDRKPDEAATFDAHLSPFQANSFEVELKSLQNICQPIMTHFYPVLVSSVDDGWCTDPKDIGCFADKPYSYLPALRFLPSSPHSV